jgi:hypothetical protein
MKTTLTFLSCFLVSIVMLAQHLPNQGFESWEDFGSYEEPTGWNTPNPFTDMASVTVVTKSEDAASGNFSARLETMMVFGGFSAPGLITLADFDVNLISGDFSITGGIVSHDRPVKIKGMYKYSSPIEDSALLTVYNYKYQGDDQRDTIGMAIWHGLPVNDWTSFEADITYNSDLIPDTLNVIVLSTASESFVPGSVLYIDSLSLELQTGVQVALTNEYGIQSFPNPTHEWLNLTSNQFLGQADVVISNASGQEISRHSWHGNKNQVYVGQLVPGIYYYSVWHKNLRLHQAGFVKK